MKHSLPVEEDQRRENVSQRDDLGPNRTKSWPEPPPSPYSEQNKLLKCSASQSRRSTDDICKQNDNFKIFRNRNQEYRQNKKIILKYLETEIKRKPAHELKYIGILANRKYTCSQGTENIDRRSCRHRTGSSLTY